MGNTGSCDTKTITRRQSAGLHLTLLIVRTSSPVRAQGGDRQRRRPGDKRTELGVQNRIPSLGAYSIGFLCSCFCRYLAFW